MKDCYWCGTKAGIGCCKSSDEACFAILMNLFLSKGIKRGLAGEFATSIVENIDYCPKVANMLSKELKYGT